MASSDVWERDDGLAGTMFEEMTGDFFPNNSQVREAFGVNKLENNEEEGYLLGIYQDLKMLGASPGQVEEWRKARTLRESIIKFYNDHHGDSCYIEWLKKNRHVLQDSKPGDHGAGDVTAKQMVDKTATELSDRRTTKERHNTRGESESQSDELLSHTRNPQELDLGLQRLNLGAKAAGIQALPQGGGLESYSEKASVRNGDTILDKSNTGQRENVEDCEGAKDIEIEKHVTKQDDNHAASPAKDATKTETTMHIHNFDSDDEDEYDDDDDEANDDGEEDDEYGHNNPYGNEFFHSR